MMERWWSIVALDYHQLSNFLYGPASTKSKTPSLCLEGQKDSSLENEPRCFKLELENPITKIK